MKERERGKEIERERDIGWRSNKWETERKKSEKETGVKGRERKGERKRKR